MTLRDRSKTPPLGVFGSCGWCGGEVIAIPECAVPSREQLLSKPYKQYCVFSRRWRWCHRQFFFAAWFGPGEPPESMPGMALPGVPDPKE